MKDALDRFGAAMIFVAIICGATIGMLLAMLDRCKP